MDADIASAPSRHRHMHGERETGLSAMGQAAQTRTVQTVGHDTTVVSFHKQSLFITRNKSCICPIATSMLTCYPWNATFASQLPTPARAPRHIVHIRLVTSAHPLETENTILVHNRLAGQQGAFCFGCLRGRRPRRQLGCTSATTWRSSAGAAGSLGDAAVRQPLALAAWQRVSLGDHRPAVGTTAWRHSLPTELRLLPTEQRHNRTDGGERFR